MTSRVKILVVDDHAVVRAGISGVLAATPEFEVVGEAATGEAALEQVAVNHPHVVVLDLSMPGMGGLEAAAALRADHPALRILVLSVHDHPAYVMESVRAGADGYLRKDAEPAELRLAIRAVAQGDGYFSPAVARQLSTALRGEDGPESPAEPPGRLDALTRRERDVLDGVTAGRTNKAIAAELGLSPRTVESYRESLMRKLGVFTVAGLTRLVIEDRRGSAR